MLQTWTILSAGIIGINYGVELNFLGENFCLFFNDHSHKQLNLNSETIPPALGEWLKNK